MELKAEKRELFGKKTGALRRSGFVPAELYGHGIKNVHLSVALKDFQAVYKTAGGNTVVNLSFETKPRPVMIHDVHMDYVNNAVLSVDFHEVKMDEKITAGVPLKFVNESPAVKDLKGVLIKAMDEIEVEAFPQNMPSEIIVDLAVLKNLGDSVYIKDLSVSADYKYAVDPNTVVVTASEPEEEEIETVEVTPESVIVETEEKKAERENNKQENSNEA
ncbi:MAG: 50S ribosomal protein L25 [Patescibacteria group bacterium]|nr:50S ribosomal protein L25 [Patescibacteria group bacterium]